ncbi:MAG TPA: MFS transporter [Pseudonocardia sp.]|uniref:MFS transporter n=1 Tax=Pseudonocardia sp. TaxID=60912 RepID=UPI002C95250F|nr:MFS transporter [Pseudonocardia sp.]HTF46565.1 MFS transporter [Pseudonocardia sp.]
MTERQVSADTSSGLVPGGRRSVLATLVGNTLEWFDWQAYAIFSVFFAGQFFPKSHGVSALLGTLAIFAVGFFFRPLGGLLIAGYTDRAGRRGGLVLSVLLMAAGSLLIAISPTYAQVGVLAPVLLLIARILQGLSTGGEFAASASYLAEIAPPTRRGFVTSFFYVSNVLGTLLATLLGSVLIGALGAERMRDWGWRVPFIVGVLLALVALYLRARLVESTAFTAQRTRPERPTLRAFRDHPGAVARVVGFTVGGTVAYYTFAVYLPSYAQQAKGVPISAALWASVAAQLVLIAILPPLGLLFDRIGRRPLLIYFGLGFVLLSVPLFALMSASGWSLFAVMTIGLVLFAGYGAVAPVAMAELFPTSVRTAGIGLPYALTVAVFGGTAPYLVTALSQSGWGGVFPWYLAATCLVSLIVYLTARETRSVDLTR